HRGAGSRGGGATRRHPAPAARGTALVGLAATPLRLARRLVADQRRPGARPLRQERLPPARGRRQFAPRRALGGAPASPPPPGGHPTTRPTRPTGRHYRVAPRPPAGKRTAAADEAAPPVAAGPPFAARLPLVPTPLALKHELKPAAGGRPTSSALEGALLLCSRVVHAPALCGRLQTSLQRRKILPRYSSSS